MNLLNTEYITLENLLDSVKGDFKKYNEAGLIDDAALYKIVAYCNANAGIRINPILDCIIEVKNGKGNLPDGFKKVKSIKAISNFKVPSSKPLYQNWTEQVTTQPQPNTPVYTPMGCHTDCGTCYWVVPYKETSEQFLIFSETNDLTIANSNLQLGNTQYSIDKENGVINFGFKEGKAVMCFYADLDELGLIPKEPMLYFYYEWCIKVKILQDILMNSDDDVSQKLQYAEKEKMGAFIDFDGYIKSQSFKKSQIQYKQREQEFFDTYFKPFY